MSETWIYSYEVITNKDIGGEALLTIGVINHFFKNRENVSITAAFLADNLLGLDPNIGDVMSDRRRKQIFAAGIQNLVACGLLVKSGVIEKTTYFNIDKVARQDEAQFMKVSMKHIFKIMKIAPRKFAEVLRFYFALLESRGRYLSNDISDDIKFKVGCTNRTKLAETTGIPATTISNYFKALVDAEIIFRQRRFDPTLNLTLSSTYGLWEDKEAVKRVAWLCKNGYGYDVDAQPVKKRKPQYKPVDEMTSEEFEDMVLLGEIDPEDYELALGI